jgi:uncharacterized protein YndB with AHSA1/START domain
MSSPVVLSVTHRYSATPERVFDAWLTPWQASRFLFRTRAGTVMQCELQPEVGGSFTVIERRFASEGDESVFNVVHTGKYLEISRPHRLVFDLHVLAFSDETTRVTVDITSAGLHTSDILLRHELGDSPYAHSIADVTRREWTHMLATLERELFPRRVGVNL